jgi:hypothetical protein
MTEGTPLNTDSIVGSLLQMNERTSIPIYGCASDEELGPNRLMSDWIGDLSFNTIFMVCQIDKKPVLSIINVDVDESVYLMRVCCLPSGLIGWVHASVFKGIHLGTLVVLARSRKNL